MHLLINKWFQRDTSRMCSLSLRAATISLMWAISPVNLMFATHASLSLKTMFSSSWTLSWCLDNSLKTWASTPTLSKCLMLILWSLVRSFSLLTQFSLSTDPEDANFLIILTASSPIAYSDCFVLAAMWWVPYTLGCLVRGVSKGPLEAGSLL